MLNVTMQSSIKLNVSILSVVVLSVAPMSVIMLIVVMPSIIMASAVMMNVVAPNVIVKWLDAVVRLIFLSNPNLRAGSECDSAVASRNREIIILNCLFSFLKIVEHCKRKKGFEFTHKCKEKCTRNVRSNSVRKSFIRLLVNDHLLFKRSA